MPARKNNSRTDGRRGIRAVGAKSRRAQQINIYVELMSLLGWFSNERKRERATCAGK
jgi:hypothetical protein